MLHALSLHMSPCCYASWNGWLQSYRINSSRSLRKRAFKVANSLTSCRLHHRKFTRIPSLDLLRIKLTIWPSVGDFLLSIECWRYKVIEVTRHGHLRWLTANDVLGKLEARDGCRFMWGSQICSCSKGVSSITLFSLHVAWFRSLHRRFSRLQVVVGPLCSIHEGAITLCKLTLGGGSDHLRPDASELFWEEGVFLLGRLHNRQSQVIFLSFFLFESRGQAARWLVFLEEGLRLRLVGPISSRLLVALLLEELLGVVLDLAETSARSFRDSRWGRARFSTLHCKQNPIFVVIVCCCRGFIAEFCR